MARGRGSSEYFDTLALLWPDKNYNRCNKNTVSMAMISNYFLISERKFHSFVLIFSVSTFRFSDCILLGKETNNYCVKIQDRFCTKISSCQRSKHNAWCLLFGYSKLCNSHCTADPVLYLRVSNQKTIH